MTRLLAFRAGLAACAALFALAFVVAPHSCKGGLDVYVWSGLACFAAVIVAPFILHRGEPASKRAGLAVLLAFLVFVSWFAGGAFANVQILCRLF